MKVAGVVCGVSMINATTTGILVNDKATASVTIAIAQDTDHEEISIRQAIDSSVSRIS